MHDNIDHAAPNVAFKDSHYYKQKRHLRGLMNEKSLKSLKHEIKEGMGDH